MTILCTRIGFQKNIFIVLTLKGEIRIKFDFMIELYSRLHGSCYHETTKGNFNKRFAKSLGHDFSYLKYVIVKAYDTN